MVGRRVAALLAAFLLAALSIMPAVPVRGSPSVTVSLSQGSGPIGAVVTVSGTISSAGAHFSVFWDNIKDWDGRAGLIAEGYANGSNYQINVTVPPASRGDHYIIVRDDNNMETGYATFTVLPEISVEPNSAPAGAAAVVSGYLINGGELNVTLEGGAEPIQLGSNVSDAVTGFFTLRFTVPAASPGGYVLSVYWGSELQASAPFTVAQSPAIALSPNSGYPGDLVNIAGQHFAPNSHVIVFFDSTPVAEADANDTGAFEANFTVPEADPEVHIVTAIDDFYNVPASATFRILRLVEAGEAVIRPRSMLYYQGDAISLYVNSTVQFQPATDIVFELWDPSGVPFTAHRISAAQVVEVGGCYMAPYNISVVNPSLPSDAEAGVWNWSVTYYVAGDPNPKRIEGQILVVPRVDMYQVLNMLSGINSKLGFIQANQNQIIALIQDSQNTILLRLDGLENNILNPLLSGFSDVSSRLTSIESLLSSVDARLSGIEDGLARIESGVGTILMRLDGLETLIQNLNASIIEVKDGVARIELGVAEIEADLDVLDASIIEVRDGVAYINTTLGVMNASLAALNSKIVEVNDGISDINTILGDVQVELSELNATITSLIVDSKGEILAEIDSKCGSLSARLDALDAKIDGIEGGVISISTALGNVEVSLEEVRNLVEGLNASIEDISSGVATIKAGVNELKANLDALNATIIDLIKGEDGLEVLLSTSIGNLTASLDSLNAKVTAVEENLVNIETALGDIQIIVEGVESLAYDIANATAYGNSTIPKTLEEIIEKADSIEGVVLNVIVPKLGEVKFTSESAADETRQTISGFSIVIYAATAAAVAAAALSAVNLFAKRPKGE